MELYSIKIEKLDKLKLINVMERTDSDGDTLLLNTSISSLNLCADFYPYYDEHGRPDEAIRVNPYNLQITVNIKTLLEYADTNNETARYLLTKMVDKINTMQKELSHLADKKIAIERVISIGLYYTRLLEDDLNKLKQEMQDKISSLNIKLESFYSLKTNLEEAYLENNKLKREVKNIFYNEILKGKISV